MQANVAAVDDKICRLCDNFSESEKFLHFVSKRRILSLVRGRFAQKTSAMDTLEKDIWKLNCLLRLRKWDELGVKSKMTETARLHGLQLRVVHFWKYPPEAIAGLKRAKIDAIKEMDFEQAARVRTIERVYLHYDEQRTAHQLDHSRFIVSDRYLLFCHLAENERAELVCKWISNVCVDADYDYNNF
jgi:hypothetical protein